MSSMDTIISRAYTADMNKLIRNVLIFTFVVSPLVAGGIIGSLQPPNSIYGFAIIFYVIVGIPSIALIGLLFSYLTRKSAKSHIYSVASYAIPASIVIGLEILAALRK